MILIVTRHGETIENHQGILSGHLDGKLSELGIEQSRQLAERLKTKQIDYIYCSDLLRARETAEEIARFHPDAPLYFDTRLRETDYRGLTGKPRSAFDFINWSPEVESREEMQTRVKDLLDQVYAEHPEGTVLFVGHAGSIRALLTVLDNKPADAMKDIRGLINTAIFMYKVEGSHYTKVLYNSIEHLSSTC